VTGVCEAAHTNQLTIALVLYEGMTTLDAVGPMALLRFLPRATVELVAEATGPVRTDSVLQLVATTICKHPCSTGGR
jgi:putative intracellular protease/amidase